MLAFIISRLHSRSSRKLDARRKAKNSTKEEQQNSPPPPLVRYARASLLEMARIPVQIIADPVASQWLNLSAADGVDGLSVSLEQDQPIDVQLARFVAERQNLRNSFGIRTDASAGPAADHAAAAAVAASYQQQQLQQQRRTGGSDAAGLLPPPPSLGIIAFSRTPASSEILRKMNLRNPLPKRRGLGLDSLLLFSETLLPGVDRSASTAGSSDDLVAYLNSSGLEASPWQIVHSGCTPADYATISGHNPAVSFGAQAAGTAAAESAAAAASAEGDGKNSVQPPPPPSPRSTQPPPTPGRITFVLVGDLLSYCHQGIFAMVASMVRPFRHAAPRVLEPSLLAYCAQESVIVASGLRVSRDGCAVWRPRTDGGSRARHASMIHKSGNSAMENALSVPVYENGAAIFVNHAIGPASHHVSSSGNGGAAAIAGTAFRRVFRITWTDAFNGAEHGGPEGRKRFSAPCVAVGVIHSTAALPALRQAEQSHVFGRMRDSVMWCMSSDAALFPGPHLSAVRGPSFQVQPHLYVPNPLAGLFRSSSHGSAATASAATTPAAAAAFPGGNNGNNINIVAASVSGSKSRSDFAAELTQHRQTTYSAATTHNPTVVSTTVTIICDPSMQAVTFLNNGRRVASWDISTIWAMKQREASEQQQQPHRGGLGSASAGELSQAELSSVFYPVVDIGSAGTVVELVC